MTRRIAPLVLAALAAASLAGAAPAGAARGVQTLNWKLYSGGFDLAPLPDGRFLASTTVRRKQLDRMAVLRFGANGIWDRRFGRRGIAEALVSPGGFVDPTELLVRPSGRIVVAGTVTTTKELVFGDTGFAGAGFTADGRLDGAFGTGGKADWTAGDGADDSLWMAPQPDGSVLLGGGTQMGGNAGGVPIGCVLPLDSELHRLPGNPQTCEKPAGPGDISFTAGVTDPAGGAVMAVSGHSGRAGHEHPLFGIARADASAAIDRGFATNGYNLVADFGERPTEGIGMGATAIAPRPGGGWLVAGAAPKGVGLVGYTAQGALDPAFAGGGQTLIDPTPDPEIVAQAVPLADGSTMLVAFTFAEVTKTPRRGVLVKVRPDGRLDPSFGRGGTLVVTARMLGIEEVDSLGSVMERPGGRLIVLGTAYRRLDQNIAMLLFRLKPNGKLDRSFGPRPKRRHRPGRP